MLSTTDSGSISERIEYARRLEKIESVKARERMSDGGKGKENFPTLQTRDVVAEKVDIGSGKQYEKEKYIVDNADTLTPEDFAEASTTGYRQSPVFIIKCLTIHIILWYIY